MKCSFSFLAFSLLLLSGNVLAWGDDMYCYPKDVVSGECNKGDLFYASSPQMVMKFCDFDKKIVSVTSGDAQRIRGGAFCFYRGSERERRYAEPSTSGLVDPCESSTTGIVDRFDRDTPGLVNPFTKFAP